MVVDRRVARRPRQVLVLAVHDVHVRLRVAVALGEPEVDDVDDVGSAPQAHEEVVGLDVAVDERLGVDVLDAQERLVCDHEHRALRPGRRGGGDSGRAASARLASGLQRTSVKRRPQRLNRSSRE